MKPFTTAQRLRQLMNLRGLRQADIIEAAEPYCKNYNVKLGKNSLSQYLSGRSEPGQDKLTVLGLALGVSEAWLMGYDVPMERQITPVTDEDDRRLVEMIDLFRLLTDNEKDMIIASVKGILSSR